MAIGACSKSLPRKRWTCSSSSSESRSKKDQTTDFKTVGILEKPDPMTLGSLFPLGPLTTKNQKGPLTTTWISAPREPCLTTLLCWKNSDVGGLFILQTSKRTMAEEEEITALSESFRLLSAELSISKFSDKNFI